MNTKDFAIKIRSLRKLRKISQTQLAGLLGVSQATVSSIESGQTSNSEILVQAYKLLKGFEFKENASTIATLKGNEFQFETKHTNALEIAAVFAKNPAFSMDVYETEVSADWIFTLIADFPGSGNSGALDLNLALRTAFVAIVLNLPATAALPQVVAHAMHRALLKVTKIKNTIPAFSIIAHHCTRPLVRIANFGMPQPILIGKSEKETRLLPSMTIDSLSEMYGKEDAFVTQILQPGESVFIGTDGIRSWIEAETSNLPKTSDFIRSVVRRFGKPEVVLKAMINALEEAVGKSTDDVTALLIKAK